MTRVVKEKEYAAKRNEILDAAQRLVFTKGYEQMSIQDILDVLSISKGAFYHYFDSKPALLEAFIERGQDNLDKAFRLIVDDPNLSAIDKFQRFFATLDRLRIEQKAFLADVARVWFADDNAIVREKTDEVIVKRRAPLLAAIVRQGVQEGVFTTPYPDQAGIVILSITRGMGNALVKLMLAFERARDELHYIDDIIATASASAEAIERVLGTSTQIVARPDAEAVQAWGIGLNEDAVSPSADRIDSTDEQRLQNSGVILSPQ
jgi:AcrR family transcriptional regulator